MADDTAHTWEDDRRVRAIAREHIVGATFVGGFAVGHGAGDCDLISDFSGLASDSR